YLWMGLRSRKMVSKIVARVSVPTSGHSWNSWSKKSPSERIMGDHQGIDDPDLELAKKMSLEAHQEKGEGDDADMERAIKLSLDPAFLPQGQAPVGGVTIRDPVSETTPKLPPEVVAKVRLL
ncbi:hypothetical protein Tco_0325538, partial [Tanacetum coccineum]